MKYHPVAGRRFKRWPSIFFLSAISLVALIGCPLYLYANGISWPGLLIFIGMSCATLIAITGGYHRLYSHKTYQANALYRFLMLGFGAAALQQSALKWSSLHRTHHQFTDTDKDPYNIKKGFLYAHVGWILFWIRMIDYSNVKDMERDKMVVHQDRYYHYWATAFGIVFPLVIGALFGELEEAFLFGIGARLFIVFQVTFFINSFAHTFGSQEYDKTISARDNWLGGILTFGEGYHSFHHRFPNDYRNGVKWYQIDPSKWFIYLCEKLGWTWDLKRTPYDKILAARELSRNS